MDYAYSARAWNDKFGFTAAQGCLNVVETTGYLVYLWIVYNYGVAEGKEGRGAPSPESVGWFGERRTLRGQWAGIACLLGLSVTVMTWSKTILYCEWNERSLFLVRESLTSV